MFCTVYCYDYCYYEGTNSAVCFQALLTRVAKTGQGAVELLRCGLVAQLIECQVFDMVPDSDAHRYGCGEGRREVFK